MFMLIPSEKWTHGHATGVSEMDIPVAKGEPIQVGLMEEWRRQLLGHGVLSGIQNIRILLLTPFTGLCGVSEASSLAAMS